LKVLDGLNRRELKLVTAHALLNGSATQAGQAYAAADAFFQRQIFERLEVFRTAGSLPPTTRSQPLAALIFSAINGEFHVWLADDNSAADDVLSRVREHLTLLLPSHEEGESAPNPNLRRP
jgi:AcrR family transcriptional regulator